MGKLLTLILIVILAMLIGGLYGSLHDQLTYIISPEYYTRFKFHQFGLVDNLGEAILPNPRLAVAIVGFLATWWMGIPIGIILGLTGLIHPGWKRMLTVTCKAILVTVLLAFLTGVVGFLYGHFYLAHKTREDFPNWYFPENLVDFKSFVTVGSIHNFSYLGGITGLISGIVYSTRQKRKPVST